MRVVQIHTGKGTGAKSTSPDSHFMFLFFPLIIGSNIFYAADLFSLHAKKCVCPSFAPFGFNQ